MVGGEEIAWFAKPQAAGFYCSTIFSWICLHRPITNLKAVGLRGYPGQPDLEAGVTASTSLFFYAPNYCVDPAVVGAEADSAGAVGIAGAGAAAVGAAARRNAGSIQLSRSCTS